MLIRVPPSRLRRKSAPSFARPQQGSVFDQNGAADLDAEASKADIALFLRASRAMDLTPKLFRIWAPTPMSRQRCMRVRALPCFSPAPGSSEARSDRSSSSAAGLRITIRMPRPSRLKWPIALSNQVPLVNSAAQQIDHRLFAMNAARHVVAVAQIAEHRDHVLQRLERDWKARLTPRCCRPPAGADRFAPEAARSACDTGSGLRS